MYLMLDIVLNHTSHKHEWAEKAKAGDPVYQDYFYMYEDRNCRINLTDSCPIFFRKVHREISPIMRNVKNG